MHAHVQEPSGTIVPTLRYRDVAAAVDWLCNAFGFERHQIVSGEGGVVRYAELTFGGGMIMLAPVEDSAFGGLMVQPQEAGGAETQICYLFVDDAAAHCARAKAAGAEIVLDIEKADGSGRGYSCRDLEGHIWSFGTYNPWKRRAGQPGPAERRSTAAGLGQAVLVCGLLLATAASAVVVAWGMGGAERGRPEPAAAMRMPGDAIEAAEHTLREVREQLARERSAKEAAERGAGAAREQLAQARDAADRAVKEAQARLAQERTAREASERAAKEARERLAKVGAEQAAEEANAARERSALEGAQRAAQEAREQLALTQRAAEAAREELAAERAARLAAEQSSRQAQEELARVQATRVAARSAEQEEREAQARERAAKEARERAAKEAAERAAREAQERQRTVRRPAPRAQGEPSPGITPYTIWPK